MVRPQRPEQDQEYGQERNGFAGNKQTKDYARDVGENVRHSAEEATESVRHMRPDYQGYLLMAIGVLVFLFSIGLFPILKWVMVALSVGLMIWGAVRSDLFKMISDYTSRMSSHKHNKKR